MEVVVGTDGDTVGRPWRLPASISVWIDVQPQRRLIRPRRGGGELRLRRNFEWRHEEEGASCGRCRGTVAASSGGVEMRRGMGARPSRGSESET